MRNRERRGSFIQNDPVDPLGNQELQVNRFLILLIVAVAEQHAIAGLLGGILGTTHNGREEGIGDVGHDHAQRVGLLFGQTAGQQVGTVIQLANSSFDTASQGRAHPAGVVDHRRHGEYRNLSLTGHVVDAGHFGTSVRGSRSLYVLRHKRLRLYNTIKGFPKPAYINMLCHTGNIYHDGDAAGR